jgi:hypothetical protein
MSDIISIPVAKVAPHYVCLYTELSGYNRGAPEYDISQHNVNDRTYNGFMSPTTKRKVSQYLNVWMSAIMQGKKERATEGNTITPYLTFVTLTLPAEQMHDDNFIKRNCLIPFIADLKRLCNVKHYFWRAEAQKNGNIHFHLLIDTRIRHEVLRELWNSYMLKYGYIDKYRQNQQHRHLHGFTPMKSVNEKWTTEKQKAAYERGVNENWSNPNSTDIHSLRKIRSVSSYVVKYCCKTEGHRPIKGRIHGCSDSLRELKYYGTVQANLSPRLYAALNDTAGIRKVTTEHAVMFYGNIRAAIEKWDYNLRQQLHNYYTTIYQQLYETETENEVELVPIEIYRHPANPIQLTLPRNWN